MENSQLTELYNSQEVAVPPFDSKKLIDKAILQRRAQHTGMTVMALTVGILIVYAVWQFPKEINMFIAGLFIMISSLIVRIVVEYYSRLRKVSGMLQLDARNYLKSLQAYYKWRQRIHFAITPLCFGAYLYGLIQLSPYFKTAFSTGFYTYLIVSAIISLLAIAAVIVNQVVKELKFLRELHH